MNYPETVWCKFWHGATKYLCEFAYRKVDSIEAYVYTGKCFVLFPHTEMDKSEEEIRLTLAIYGVDEIWEINVFKNSQPWIFGLDLFYDKRNKKVKLEI